MAIQIRNNTLEQATALKLQRFATCPAHELFDALDARAEGLTAQEHAQRLEDVGRNVIQSQKPRPAWMRFLGVFVNPFTFVLLAVGAVSLATDVFFAAKPDATTPIILVALILLSGILQYFSESRSSAAAEKLKDMVHTNATALRDGEWREVPIDEIVPGDIVRLSAGDMLPADVRVLAAKDLFVGQSSLTGESEPVEKWAASGGASWQEFENMCYMGTDVVSGSATCIAVLTGNDTMLAASAASLREKRVKTSFERGVSDVSRMLMRLMLIMVPVIFVVNGLVKHDWVTSLLFALSVAVGLTPEMLPVIMTATLARGALVMSKHKTIVKNLYSIQNFGAMDILCTDKTGTLTEDRIVLETYRDIHGQEDRRVLRHAYLNSEYQTGLKNLMDRAVIERASAEGVKAQCTGYRKVDEIPFDFARRRMSVVLEWAGDEGDARDGAGAGSRGGASERPGSNGGVAEGKRQLITKGAIEEMLAICSYAEYHGEVLPLTDEIRAEVTQHASELNDDGMRVIAVAQKNEVHDVETFSVADESDMVLMGFIGFLDPPKPTSKAAIEALHAHGVRVVVLTGDNDRVARKICGDVGLHAQEVVTGDGIDGMTDEQLADLAERADIFAKLSPLQKRRVVSVLQARGHTVGYMGDGINDAPAMHQADIGISVDTAVDIAKETADIILLEKSLLVLGEGVIEGRRTFGNIVKYVSMAASSNFGNMFSLLVASIFLPFLPMLPIQILAQNFLYDISQIGIPYDNVDEEFLRAPQRWDAKNMARFTYWMGPLSSVFDVLTFLALWFLMGGNSVAHQAVFQTGWFLFGLVSQTLIVHLIRTRKVPFVQSIASKPLLLTTVAIAIVGLVLPWTPLGPMLDMAPISLGYYGIMAVLLLGYSLATQLLKRVYIRRYGAWL